MVGGCSLLVVLMANAGFAEGTRTWTQSKFEELAKGTATGVALDSRGGIELAPEFKQVYATPSTYIWAITADDAGNVYAAAGSPARVYQVSPEGRAVVIFEAKELQVQAITMSGGVVYAATAPDGKLYRIEHKGTKVETAKTESGKRAADISMPAVDASWSATEVFAPKSKYIWSLVADVQGNIYVATGDPGEIYKVTPKGEHSLLFKSDETHIRVLALDGKGNVIAGSDGSGLIYRISMAGEGFVLFSAPKKEITALALDGAGNIYAAAAGEKHTGGGSSGAGSLLAPMAGLSANGPGAAIQPQAPGVGNALGGSVGAGLFPFAGAAGGGSEIYRISPDGTPQRTWASRDDLVYALAVDGGGLLLAGTGNKGRVFAVPGMDEYSDLGKATAAQVTAFAWTRDGVLHVATGNLGKIFALGPKPPVEGTFESDVFDAKAHSRWGRVEFRGAGNVDLFARSGNVDNPDRNWSAWKRVDLGKDAVAQVPIARFAQWKAVLHAGSVAPRVESVGLNYLPRNVAPEVEEVTVQVGVKYQPQPKMGGASGGPDIGAITGIPHFESSAPSTRERDSIGVKWSARDDNDDQLVYSLYYRGDGESQWLLLKDNLTDKSYSFDASLLPDGGYTVRVVASDAPSHAPGEALTTTKESARFEVDTTPPRIEELAASLESGQVRIRFHAVDGFSPIKKAEYSLDAGEWKYVEPVAQISDAKTEDYDFHVPLTAGVEHVVVVRVYDRYDNLGAAKTVVRGK